MPCQPNSYTGPGARSASDCTCNPGYFASSTGVCSPCPPQLYKATQGNEECKLRCPANADSSIASTELEDCFCMVGHHALLDDAGALYRCASCAVYEGLSCLGGFLEDNKDAGHRQPVSNPGFFQTGDTLAVECEAQSQDGLSACLGGFECATDDASQKCALEIVFQSPFFSTRHTRFPPLFRSASHIFTRPGYENFRSRCAPGSAGTLLKFAIHL